MTDFQTFCISVLCTEYNFGLDFSTRDRNADIYTQNSGYATYADLLKYQNWNPRMATANQNLSFGFSTVH